jgi:glutathione synthase/RimK-type ligase-like ATP-grasp enzyme
MLLILTEERDFAADYLIVELIKRELPYFRLNAEDIASANILFEIDGNGRPSEIVVGPRTLRLQDVRAVWYRRALQPNPDRALPIHERRFVAGELRHLFTALALNIDGVWVNPIHNVSVAEHKLLQLQIARRIGLKVPRTLVSRDVARLREFARDNKAGTICKPIFHGLYFDGESRFSAYTRRIEPDDLDEEAASACPILLQEEIPRSADIRATIIGPHCFVAEIKSDDRIIDWRDPCSAVRYAISHLDGEIEQKCREVLRHFGLVYGAFDLIRTPNGELVFLEVNPTGEWAWLEDRLGFPMRDAFIELFFGGENAVPS